MKDHQDLRKLPRIQHTERYDTHYTLVDNHVRIEKFTSMEMLDLNFQGMGVQTEQPLPVDALVNFDIYFDGDEHNVTARVLWTKSIGQFYRSGLAFDEIPEVLIQNIKRFLSNLASKKYQN